MSGRQPGLPRPSLAASAAPPPHAPCPLNFHCPAYLPYRHSICLVCKSWNSLFFQAPGLWRSLLLDGRLAAARGKLAAWLAAKRSLLARLGSVVTVAHAELVDPEEDFFIERYPLDTRMSEDEGEDEGAQPSDSQPSGDAWDSVAAAAALPAGVHLEQPLWSRSVCTADGRRWRPVGLDCLEFAGAISAVRAALLSKACVLHASSSWQAEWPSLEA